MYLHVITSVRIMSSVYISYLISYSSFVGHLPGLVAAKVAATINGHTVVTSA